MGTELGVITVICVANGLLALVFLIVSLIKKDYAKGIVMFFTMLVIPVVGIIFWGVSGLFNTILRHVHKDDDKNSFIEGIFFQRKKIKESTQADTEKALNTVPMNEVLMISDTKERRQAFLDLIKEEKEDVALSVMQSAVNSEDTEIAHYAATFAAETLRKYKASEYEARTAVQKNGTPDNLAAYLAVVSDIVDKNLFTVHELLTIMPIAAECATRLCDEKMYEGKDEVYKTMIDLSGAVGNQEQVEYWINGCQEHAMEDLHCFKICTEYYYRIKDRTRFFANLQQIKQASITFDSDVLSWIRYFKEERRV